MDPKKSNELRSFPHDLTDTLPPIIFYSKYLGDLLTASSALPLGVDSKIQTLFVTGGFLFPLSTGCNFANDIRLDFDIRDFIVLFLGIFM